MGLVLKIALGILLALVILFLLFAIGLYVADPV